MAARREGQVRPTPTAARPELAGHRRRAASKDAPAVPQLLPELQIQAAARPVPSSSRRDEPEPSESPKLQEAVILSLFLTNV